MKVKILVHFIVWAVAFFVLGFFYLDSFDATTVELIASWIVLSAIMTIVSLYKNHIRNVD
jgi:uncharacterized phage infection (PIP) family protein YhgE